MRSLPAISARWSVSAAYSAPIAPASAAWSARGPELQARSASAVFQARTAIRPASRFRSASSKAVQPSDWSAGRASSPVTSAPDQPG